LREGTSTCIAHASMFSHRNSVTTLSRLHHQHVVRYYHAWIDDAEDDQIGNESDDDISQFSEEEEEEEEEEEDNDLDASDWFGHASISASRNPRGFSESYSSEAAGPVRSLQNTLLELYY